MVYWDEQGRRDGGRTEMGGAGTVLCLQKPLLMREQWGCQDAAHTLQPGGLEGQRPEASPALPSETLQGTFGHSSQKLDSSYKIKCARFLQDK